MTILQWHETQIDAAHEPEHLPGQMHGHTWTIAAALKIDPEQGWITDYYWGKEAPHVTASPDARPPGAHP